MYSKREFETQANCLTCLRRQRRSFCNISGTPLRHQQHITKTFKCGQGKVLYREGEPAEGVFILCNGRVKLSIASGRGNVMILKIAQAGEALGLTAVLSQGPHQETAELLECCQVKLIPKEHVSSHLSGNASMAFKMLLQMSNDYNSAREQIRRLGFSISGTQKLARLLLEWANHGGNPQARESIFTVPYTHEEIAHMIGTTRETVTRALMKFRTRKVLEVQGKTFIVRDLEKLADSIES